MEQFPVNWMRSKKGKSREEDFYLEIEEKKDFLDHYTINYRCTDLQIKFFKSVMDGKVKFVKHAFNIGSIRNDHYTMRAAIILACRFGQAIVLESLLNKVHDHFFKAENLNYVVAIVAAISEAGRLETSGIIDAIIKYARKSFDKDKARWVSGKIDLDWTAFGKFETTPFMQICGTKNGCMSDVVKKILEDDEYLLDVNQVIGETSEQVGNSALTHAVLTGEQEVVKIIVDKMRWEKSNALETSNMNHLQCVLASYIHYLSQYPHIQSTDVNLFAQRDDRIDIIQILIEKCFRATQENKIGHNNTAFMQKYSQTLFVHEHFDAMVFSVIEEERRIAHANGKTTWYDLYDLEIVEGPWTKQGKGPTGTHDRNFYGDQLDRYLKSFAEGYDALDKIVGSFVYVEKLLVGLEKKEKCWSCGDQDSRLQVCKQCREARYCDALCQDEDWEKHQQWCREKRKQIKREREAETREEKEARKATRKNTKDIWDGTTLASFQMAMAFQVICNGAKKVENY